MVLFAQCKWPQHHAAIKDPPSAGHKLVRGQIQIVEQLLNHEEECELEACPKHGLIHADFVTV